MIDRVRATFILTVAQCQTVGEIDAWCAAAKKGATLVYAQGRFAPSRHPGFVYVRGLVERGLIAHCPQQKDRETGAYSWSVRRTAMAWHKPAPLAQPQSAGALSERETALLDLCRRHAAAKTCLPTNAIIAEYLGLRTSVDASNMLRKLIALHFINLSYRDGLTLRRVEILR